jgi:hypothetical protein
MGKIILNWARDSNVRKYEYFTKLNFYKFYSKVSFKGKYWYDNLEYCMEMLMMVVKNELHLKYMKHTHCTLWFCTDPALPHYKLNVTLDMCSTYNK